MRANNAAFSSKQEQFISKNAYVLFPPQFKSKTKSVQNQTVLISTGYKKCTIMEHKYITSSTVTSSGFGLIP